LSSFSASSFANSPTLLQAAVLFGVGFWTWVIPLGLFYQHRTGAGRIFNPEKIESLQMTLITRSTTLPESCLMAKNKQQKKKEREKLVAQKKLAIAAKKRTQDKATKDSQQTSSSRTRVMGSTAPKTKPIVSNKKNTFTQRRSGG